MAFSTLQNVLNVLQIAAFPKTTKNMKFEDPLRYVRQSLKDPPISAFCSVFISKLKETGRHLTVFEQRGVDLSRCMALNLNFG